MLSLWRLLHKFYTILVMLTITREQFSSMLHYRHNIIKQANFPDISKSQNKMSGFLS